MGPGGSKSHSKRLSNNPYPESNQSSPAPLHTIKTPLEKNPMAEQRIEPWIS